LSVSLPQRPDGVPVMAHRLVWWRPAAGGVALCLLILAALLLSNAQLLTLPIGPRLARTALLVIGVAFIGRALVPNRYVGLFKSLQTTRWAAYDTRLYSPLFLLLGLLIVRQTL
jgi:phosphoglycerol transferase MdoB-like AlkP superfamily enzyme